MNWFCNTDVKQSEPDHSYARSLDYRSSAIVRTDIPPFGTDDDPDIQQALDWLLSFVRSSDWNNRLARIEQRLSDDSALPSSMYRQVGYAQQTWPDADRMGWYLYLGNAAVSQPFNYEPREGCRIIPILKRLGMHLPDLKAIDGVEERVRRLVAETSRQPDSILFELLVALLWKTNGFNTVELLDESSNGKTPDIRAINGTDEWFIECKRLDRHSQYTRMERDKWQAMWSLLSDCLVRSGHSVVLDICFHVEISTLPDDYLADQLPGKLDLVHGPTHLISNETLDVIVSPVDYVSVNRHLESYWVRCPSDQLDELVAGERDPNRGFSAVIAGEFEEFDRATFLGHMSFAAGAFWFCDAPAAVLAKARHVKSRLASAIDQLPNHGKGAVHIGIETVDGAMVEEARSLRNRQNVSNISRDIKGLRWVYCHLLQFYAPPRGSWVVDETVEHYGTQPTHPLREQSIFPSDEGSVATGKHWHRSPP